MIRDMASRARFYIDGFNFYYGAVKGTPWKWLDFEAICGSLVRGLSVDQIHYFTARVKDRPDDPAQSQRQDDSDLQTPVDLVRGLGKDVVIVNPHRHGRQRPHLFGSRAVNLRRWHLANHQLEDPVITDTGGTIHRPQGWA
jgi:hypothetical protein